MTSARARRLGSPTAFLAFLSIAGLGAPLALGGCSGEARAEASSPARLWTEGNGKSIVKDAAYDPRLSLAPLLDTVRPAVVSVRVRTGSAGAGRFPFGPDGLDGTPGGVGSGFILTSDGLVVTNHHVVASADSFEVELDDDRVFSGKLLGSDPATDVALLQLEGARDLPTVVVGSSEDLRVGDWVVAIGTPIGLQQSASAGIVSARGRGSLGLYADSYIDFLQIDASLAPGNSGGPLFNLRGEVVGINTAVASFVPGRGPGFAIPIDQAKRVLPQLKKDGTVLRGWLGISARPVTPTANGSPRSGAVVGEVYSDTPAGRAGLEPGDRIVKVGKHAVKDFDDLRARVADYPPGKKVQLELERDGAKKTITVELSQRPDSSGMASLRRDPASSSPAPRPNGPGLWGGGEPRLGIEVKEDPRGVTVGAVREGSIGADLGLRPGDVIERINDQKIEQPQDVRRALTRSKNRVKVTVKRGQGTHTAMVERH